MSFPTCFALIHLGKMYKHCIQTPKRWKKLQNFGKNSKNFAKILLKFLICINLQSNFIEFADFFGPIKLNTTKYNFFHYLHCFYTVAPAPIHPGDPHSISVSYFQLNDVSNVFRCQIVYTLEYK